MTELVKLSPSVPIFLCNEPTKMVLGLPGLLKKIEEEARYKPYSKGIYVFVNKDFSRVKLFWWDRTGYAMLYKHVPAGTFRIDFRSGYKAISHVNLRLLLSSSKNVIETEKKNKG